MEIFLRIDGASSGPHTIYDVREMLRSGKIDPDTKTWIKGMPEWVALREFPPLENDALVRVADAGAEDIAVSDAERQAALDAVLHPVKPRPWVRLWARFIDLTLFTVLVTWLVDTTGALPASEIAYPTSQNVAAVLAIPTAWIFVEATLLLYFKTTPGKWLLNVKLRRSDGGSLELGQALRRSFSVWWRGWGFGILPLLIIGCALSNLSLNTRGKTAWDIRDDLEIEHGRVGEWRICLAIALIFISGMAILALAGPPVVPEK